jgi:hypothetical protein
MVVSILALFVWVPVSTYLLWVGGTVPMLGWEVGPQPFWAIVWLFGPGEFVCFALVGVVFLPFELAEALVRSITQRQAPAPP